MTVGLKEMLAVANATCRDVAGRIERAQDYAAAMDALELAPNGDDFNALLSILSGGPYTPPHVEGR